MKETLTCKTENWFTHCNWRQTRQTVKNCNGGKTKRSNQRKLKKMESGMQTARKEIPEQITSQTREKVDVSAFSKAKRIQTGCKLRFASNSNSSDVASVDFTNIVANTRVSLNKELSSLSARYTNIAEVSFLNRIEEISGVLEYAVDRDLVDFKQVDEMLNTAPLGGYEQASKAIDLCNVATQKLLAFPELHKIFSRVNLFENDRIENDLWYTKSSGWELRVTPLGGDDIHLWDSEYRSKAALTTVDHGVCALPFDFGESELSEKEEKIVKQLIHYCCEISGHSPTYEFLPHDYFKSLIVGDDMFFDEMDEDEREYVRERELFFNELSKEVKKLGKYSRKTTAKAISDTFDSSLNNCVSDWIIEAVGLLRDHYRPEKHFNMVSQTDGYYWLPVYFCTSHEDSALEVINEWLSEGEPIESKLVLNEETEDVLFNISLCEGILLYISLQMRGGTK